MAGTWLAGLLLLVLTRPAHADAIGQLCSLAGASRCPSMPTLRGEESPERPERQRVEREEPCLECWQHRMDALRRMEHLPLEQGLQLATPDQIGRDVASQMDREDARKLDRLRRLAAALFSAPDNEAPPEGRPAAGTPGALSDECRENPELFERLKQAVRDKCHGVGNRCRGDQDCDTLQRMLESKLACLAAREERDGRCYGGGDDVHKNVRKEVKNGIEECKRRIRNKCPGVPLP